MISLEFVKPNSENPFGLLHATVEFQDIVTNHPQEYPLKFLVYSSVSKEKIWESELFPGSWSKFFEPCNTHATICDPNGNVLTEWKWDTILHGDNSHNLFMLWCRKNKGSKGISIGTHDGTTGEWVEPLRSGLIEAFLVEASLSQFKKLVDNYRNIPGTYPVFSLVTDDGRDCEFYECPDGYTNSVFKEHTLGYSDQINTVYKKSKSLNDLICELGLAEDLAWLHLDVEGIDADLILSLDPERVKFPDLIVYESLNLDSLKKESVHKWLSVNNYEFKECGWNTIACKKPNVV